jgi:hypothetical protein
MLAMPLDLATLLLVTGAVLGYQLLLGTTPSAWIGWAGAAAVGLGFGGSLPMLCAGLSLFGISIVRCAVYPRLPGFLLIGGGVALMFGWAYAPGFGRADSGPSVGWGVVMGAALVMVAAALADLDVLERQSHPRVMA